MDIQYYRRQKNVNRLGTNPVIRPYNLLEHQYMVAMLFQHFAKLEDIPYDLDVINRILHHDIVETITGDLPYPVKHSSRMTETAWTLIEKEALLDHSELREYTDETMEAKLTPEQLKLFKTCDLLELWIFLQEEYTLGNHTRECLEILRRCKLWIMDHFRSIDFYMSTYDSTLSS